MPDHDHDVWHQAVMWHGVGMLPGLREMSWADRKQMLLEADEHNNKEPLFFCKKPQFLVPTWTTHLLTGGQVCALLVFGLWVQVGEREEMCGSLVHDWPEIKIACALVGAPQAMAAQLG